MLVVNFKNLQGHQVIKWLLHPLKCCRRYLNDYHDLPLALACSPSPPYRSLIHSYTPLSCLSIFQVAYLFEHCLSQVHFFLPVYILHPLIVTKLSHHVPFHPFHHSTLHFICTCTYAKYLMNVFIALTIPYCHSTLSGNSFLDPISCPSTVEPHIMSLICFMTLLIL